MATYWYLHSSGGYLVHFGSAANLLIYDKNGGVPNFCYGGWTYELPKGNQLCGGNKFDPTGNSSKGTGKYLFRLEQIEIYHIPQC